MSRRSSSTSNHSLCSQGPVVINPLGGEGSQQSKPHKQAAHWTDEETLALLDFLTGQPQGDGGNYKKMTWVVAESHMDTKFKTVKGGAKSTETCERWYQLMRNSYFAVVALKNASGFTYSDKDGAGITLVQNDVWSRYIKSHKFAKPFKTKGFIHFDAVECLMPDASQGKYICRGPQATNHGPATNINDSTPLNLHQLSTVADEISMANSQFPAASQMPPPPSSIPGDPNLVPPSAPSSFVSISAMSSTSSLLTSVSRPKRKLDSISAVESETSSHKQSRPLSVTALAQQASGAAIADMAATMKDISKSITTHANDLEMAMEILNEHDELTTIQKLDISDYLVDPNHLNHAVVFHKLRVSERKYWLACRLAELGHQPVTMSDQVGEMEVGNN
ncbi:hypothetical protein J3R82DRAFT_1380 [Butyriboletus roseoflavus]|nr:hypothetical protein J3R82DRAFT_1380 [Butyriboletus roseoflavus]